MKRIDLIMAANVQTALATRVQELSTTFRKKQADYLRRESFRYQACTAGKRRGSLMRTELEILAELKGHESRAVEMQTKTAYDPLFALADDEQTVGLARESAAGSEWRIGRRRRSD